MKIKTNIIVATALSAAIAVGAYVTARPTHPTAFRTQIDPALKMPAPVAAFVTKSCGDCHSTGATLPWYSKIPPASWMIEHDVRRAQRAMNLREWTGYSRGKASGLLAAACADLQSRRMPLPQYLWMHPDARPKPDEIQAFCEWTQSARRVAR
jgi:hypothetical protein